jgi:methanol metabolism-related c-type cytochrome
MRPRITGWRKLLIRIRPFTKTLAICTLSLSLFGVSLSIGADGPAVREEDGKYFDKDDAPTYKIGADGTVDWYTYSGFRRYHSECHVCHGPDGEGSTYAPALKESMETQSFWDFVSIVAGGVENVNASETSKMPALGDNKNVMCYVDDIYVYLKARADDAIPRGRPQKRADKPESAKQHEDACL